MQMDTETVQTDTETQARTDGQTDIETEGRTDGQTQRADLISNMFFVIL